MLRKLKRGARPLARFGCFSIGTVYVLVGLLALLALSGIFTGSADEDRMVHVLMRVPGGVVLIWGIVAGLAGWVLWRTAEALTDPYEFGSDWKGLACRAGVALSGLAYGLLAFSAGRIAHGGPGTSQNGEEAEEQQQLLVGQVLEWPFGAWLIGVVAVGIAGVAIGQFVLLARRGYLMEVDVDALPRGGRRTLDLLAWTGYSARAVILAVLAYFLMSAAYTANPEEAGDTDTAFDFIGGGWIGDTAFAIVAIGTIAYGLYMYLCGAFYRFERSPQA
jgi:hypothetical protein